MPLTTDIYICQRDSQQEGPPWPSSAAISRALSFQSIKRQKEYEFSRFFLDQILQKNYDLNLKDFAKGTENKPHLRGHSLKMSMSHSGDFFAYAFQQMDTPGIDIENRTINSNYTKIMNKYYSDKEQNWVQSQTSELSQRLEFRNLWSLKEAYFKAQEEGSFSIIKNMEIDREHLTAVSLHGKEGLFLHDSTPLYSLSVFTRSNPDSIRCFQWDAKDGIYQQKQIEDWQPLRLRLNVPQTSYYPKKHSL